eukprot:symbB.v1.2.004566.t1/scaffold239.1/size255824/9
MAFLSALLVFNFWASSSEAEELPNDMSTSHLYSVGDLHGDDQSYQTILKALGLLSNDGHWIGGNSILDEASASGGKVILLWGNHELMNLQHDFRYASAADTASLTGDEGSRSKRIEVFSKDGWLGSALRWRFQSVALERKVLFVHAGLLPNFSQAYGSVKGPELVKKVNEEIQNLLKQDADGLREESSPLLTFGLGYLMKLMNLIFCVICIGNGGPFWTRQLALGPEGRICPELQESLDAFGAERMVVGHTAQADGRVHSRCGGRLILGDTLISRFYTGTAHPSAIEYLTDGSLEAIDVQSRQRYTP